MADKSPDTKELPAEGEFAALMEASLAERGGEIHVGDRITGPVIAVTETTLVVDTGTKLDGVADKSEFLDDNGQLTVGEGDEVTLYVVSVRGDEVALSKALSGQGGAEALREAYENNVPVEGKVTAARKGGFDVEIVHRRAFCPVSQIDLAFTDNPEAHVGQTYQFAIITFERDGKNIVVSRRKLLEQARVESELRFMETVQPGDVVPAVISRLVAFGAFAEVAPGLEGLIHLSELSWSRAEKAEDAVTPGEAVTVKVLAFDRDKKGRPRISLSIKQAGADPWDSVGDQFTVGDKVEGKVVRLADFGAFVEIAPGIEGLIHVSEMSHVRRVAKPGDVVAVGDAVTVAVKDIDLTKRRIGLSLKEAAGDPWQGVAETFPIGATVTGTVENRQQFGIFVNLAPGVTGLLPASKLRDALEPQTYERLKIGDETTVIVSEIDSDKRKMTLSPIGGQKERENPDEWKRFVKKEKAAAPSGGLGLLGEKLQEAMSRKKK
ncbi:30S ribosomal protein S1 [Solidesulfovibrio carbinolicus]|uniref:30S ribosomal protein S1 n=1 Tax=Solidesulfovibrio carbinolicus TaxID=296842 RepID=A0A4P6HRL5_9BACT|nr:30S ribosomal protein S1 [Solidesulfovibrio carbinolicus]QAZ67948.1 30S ribosomal protein S1 [Solidesulfovibrio carbinolicus]